MMQSVLSTAAAADLSPRRKSLLLAVCRISTVMRVAAGLVSATRRASRTAARAAALFTPPGAQTAGQRPARAA